MPPENPDIASAGHRAAAVRLIRSGEWAGWPGTADYRREQIGDTLVERLVWGLDAPTRRMARRIVAAPGYVWFRFWLPSDAQVVEKFFDAEGAEIGMQVEVCRPVRLSGEEWAARDLLLRLRIDPDGLVTLANEAQFEAAAADSRLSPADVVWAEEHVRGLTTATAQGRFPPPMVRNWQIDIKRIRKELDF